MFPVVFLKYFAANFQSKLPYISFPHFAVKNDEILVYYVLEGVKWGVSCGN